MFSLSEQLKDWSRFLTLLLPCHYIHNYFLLVLFEIYTTLVLGWDKKRESWVLSLICKFRDAVAHLSMLKAAARPLGGCRPKASPEPLPGERHCWNVSLQRPYAWQRLRIAVSGLMYPVCSIWKSLVPYGISLVGACQGLKTELMSFGDSNLEDKKSPGPEFGQDTDRYSEMFLWTLRFFHPGGVCSWWDEVVDVR